MRKWATVEDDFITISFSINGKLEVEGEYSADDVIKLEEIVKYSLSDELKNTLGGDILDLDTYSTNTPMSVTVVEEEISLEEGSLDSDSAANDLLLNVFLQLEISLGGENLEEVISRLSEIRNNVYSAVEGFKLVFGDLDEKLKETLNEDDDADEESIDY